ncbi:hypothetical protein ADL27_61075 [Streptomyces sp. NRRL F-6602]|nr:hypothetical protein ADL27_61075 [Streptomyces sp. NRRL F-6602]
MADADISRAYRALEAAITEVGRLEGFDGVLTEWIVVTSTQRYDADGDTVTQIGTLMPDGGGAPYHRLMGLLDYAHTRMRAEVARDDD